MENPKAKSPLTRIPAALTPTAQEVCDWVGGALKGAPSSIHFTGLSTLDEAVAEEISFAATTNLKRAAAASEAGLLLLPTNYPIEENRARIEVAEVWPAIVAIMQRLYPQPKPEPGVHPTAHIGEGAKLGKDVSVGPFCYIGPGAELGNGASLGSHCSIDPNCRIGESTRLMSHVTLQGDVRIGRRVVIHPGAVLGADGFKYEGTRAGILKIPQIGAIIIEDDVEIGANTTIDRPFLHETRIGQGTKIDNLVQIGHNCRIGRYCLIAGCVGIAGSTVIEDGVLIGGGAGLRDGITIGKGSMIAAGSGVPHDLAPGSFVMGSVALPAREFQRANSYFKRLPQFAARLNALEAALGMAKEEKRAATPKE